LHLCAFPACTDDNPSIANNDPYPVNGLLRKHRLSLSYWSRWPAQRLLFCDMQLRLSIKISCGNTLLCRPFAASHAQETLHKDPTNIDVRTVSASHSSPARPTRRPTAPECIEHLMKSKPYPRSPTDLPLRTGLSPAYQPWYTMLNSRRDPHAPLHISRTSCATSTLPKKPIQSWSEL
jgi:hypothetical protein